MRKHVLHSQGTYILITNLYEDWYLNIVFKGDELMVVDEILVFNYSTDDVRHLLMEKNRWRPTFLKILRAVPGDGLGDTDSECEESAVNFPVTSVPVKLTSYEGSSLKYSEVIDLCSDDDTKRSVDKSPSDSVAFPLTSEKGSSFQKNGAIDLCCSNDDIEKTN